MGDEASVTLHSSWWGVIGGLLGGGVLLGGGLFGVATVGFRVVPTVLLVVGTVAVLVMALDYPVATTFTRRGAQRRMLLRRTFIAWDAEGQLTRTRPSLVRQLRKVRHGGLTYRRGRRRILLVDRVESASEFDELIDLLEADDGAASAGLGLSMLPRPDENVAPTWLYRRARWRPEWATRR